ncbi:hypothetical protein CRG98_034434 [Punica granatum]|uniref:Uncharacterized protein n=1 Tax=Punica granatum TaxID=22663 RepID=A0A2I0IN98_PUNGR|nr:hypothetical protein CRG98_034434 [Punica granatum]
MWNRRNELRNSSRPPDNALMVSDAFFMSLEVQSRQTEVTMISEAPKQLRKQTEKSSFGLLGHLRLRICITGLRFLSDRVDPRLLSQNDHCSHLRGSVGSRESLTLPRNSIGRHCGDVRPDRCQTGPKFYMCSVFHDLCRAIRVDPITLGPNDHHSHLRGSVRSQEQLTLPQNSIGNFRGDVRPDLCQSDNSGQNTEDLFRLLPVRSAGSLAFSGFLHKLDDPGNWSTPATDRGGPHCDVSLF